MEKSCRTLPGIALTLLLLSCGGYNPPVNTNTNTSRAEQTVWGITPDGKAIMGDAVWGCLKNIDSQPIEIRTDGCKEHGIHGREVHAEVYKTSTEEYDAETAKRQLCNTYGDEAIDAGWDACNSLSTSEDFYIQYINRDSSMYSSNCRRDDEFEKKFCELAGGQGIPCMYTQCSHYNPACFWGIEQVPIENEYGNVDHIEQYLSRYLVCPSNDDWGNDVPIQRLGRCDGNTSFSNLRVACATTLKEWLVQQPKKDSILLKVENCKEEAKNGFCDLSTTSRDSKYWYTNFSGMHIIDTVIYDCAQPVIMRGADWKNVSGLDQPQTEQFPSGESIYGYEKGFIDTLKSCKKSEQRVFDRVDNGDSVWVVPEEPLSCDAKIDCQSAINARKESRLLKDCDGTSPRCPYLEITDISYSPDSIIRYPRIATSFGDTGQIQSAPYHKVAIPRKSPWTVNMKIQLDTLIMDSTLLGKASILLKGSFAFMTHSEDGPTDTILAPSKSIILTKENTAFKGHGKWEFIGSFALDTVPKSVGYMGGSYNISFNRTGETSVKTRTQSDTIFVPFGIPVGSSYFPTTIQEVWEVVKGVRSVDHPDSLENPRIATVKANLYSVENKFTDFRLNQLLNAIINQNVSNTRSQDSLALALTDVSYMWVFNTLNAQDNPQASCLFKTDSSRIWKQFDGKGNGHCQEYSIALDNILRILGLSKAFDQIDVISVYARKDNCVGIKTHYPGIQAEFVLDKNLNPLGNWVFANNQFMNSLMLTKGGGKSLYPGRTNTVKKSLTDASASWIDLELAYWDDNQALILSHPSELVYKNTYSETEWRQLCGE